MSKHTPGPWAVNESSSLEVEAGKFYVAFCGPKKGLDLAQFAERQANARLIAAAPDLLEVVLAMANFDGRNNNAALKEMARAAIAKAEG